MTAEEIAKMIRAQLQVLKDEEKRLRRTLAAWTGKNAA